jgi:hypothetical protein
VLHEAFIQHLHGIVYLLSFANQWCMSATGIGHVTKPDWLLLGLDAFSPLMPSKLVLGHHWSFARTVP